MSEDGELIELGLLDNSGNAASVQLSFDQAESIIMTLPHLLGWALKKRTGAENSRYVFQLGKWSIDSAENGECLLLTLVTADGFEATFAVPFDACESLGTSLYDNAVKQKRSTGGPSEKWLPSAKPN